MSEPYKWDVENPRGYGTRMGRYQTDVEWDFITKSIQGSGLGILDIGGGSGRFAVPLADLGHNVTVCDPSEPAINLLRSRGGAGIRADVCDFLAFEPAGRFDAVLAIESLMYMNEIDLDELFAWVASMLAPGGTFVFTILNSLSPRYFVRRLRDPDPDQFSVASRSTVTGALAGAGFSVSRVEGFMWVPLPVASDSRLVPIGTRVETVCRLRRLIMCSPWLLFAATRG